MDHKEGLHSEGDSKEEGICDPSPPPAPSLGTRGGSPLAPQLHQKPRIGSGEPLPGTSCHHHTSSLDVPLLPPGQGCKPGSTPKPEQAGGDPLPCPVWDTTLRPAWPDPDDITWTASGGHTYTFSLLHHTLGFPRC